eukprot:TRINITY_DN17686_c0_g2_i1.p1 TRINITY_DN17686_c0_g2~~TRINITY_DN17686_c0_g2_i1.p1  ORF type:complete len:177 (-),score=16.56 TRINITY_DN17686_c0_g2_i1:466-996(-)
MIGMGKEHGGLYYYHLTSSSTALTAHQHGQFDIWHYRLGHPSHSRLLALSKIVDGISISSCHCDVCPLAKHARLPFLNNNKRANAPFALIHSDIWGDFSVGSISGAHYFLTIVDDYSRCTWIYLMRHKSETQSLLESSFAMVKTRFDCSVQQIRTDNGLEFMSLKHFFNEHGVIHQ